MLKKLMAGAVAGFLLVGASDAMARVVSAWLVVGVSSASGTVELEEDLCMAAVVELNGQGFTFVTMTNLEPRLAALFFQKSGETSDAATLFCLANIIEEQLDLFE